MEIKKNNINTPIIQSSKVNQPTPSGVKEDKKLDSKKLALSLAGLAVIGAGSLAVMKMLKNGKIKPVAGAVEELKTTLSKKITSNCEEFKGKFSKGMAFSENGEKFTGNLTVRYGDELLGPNYVSLKYEDGKIIRSFKRSPDIKEPILKEYTYHYDDAGKIEKKTVKLVNTQIIKDKLPERISAKINAEKLSLELERGSKYEDIIANGKALDALDDITLQALKNDRILHLLKQTQVAPEIMQGNAKAIKAIHLQKISDLGEGLDAKGIDPEKLLKSINEGRISKLDNFVVTLLKQDKISPEILENNLKVLNKSYALNCNSSSDAEMMLKETIDANDIEELINKAAVYLLGN